MGYQVGGSADYSQSGLETGYNNYNAQGVRSDSYVGNTTNMTQNDMQHIPVGSTFRGEVMDVTGDKVWIQTESGQVVQARMAEQMNFNIGDKVLFQIKSNGDGVIEIKPIAATLQGQEQTILKALEAAKLPVTEKTVMMVQQLLREQMPIDKNSLQEMYKQILSNKDVNSSTLVQMKKLGLPITKESVGQFEAYRNYEHRISAEVLSFSEQLTELLRDTAGQNTGQQLHKMILSLFLPDSASGQEAPGSMSGTMPGIMPRQEVPGGVFHAEDGQMQADGVVTAGTKQSANPESLVAMHSLGHQNQIGRELSVGERQELARCMWEMAVPDDSVQKVLDGTMDSRTLLHIIKTQVLQAGEANHLQELLQNPGYCRLLKKQICNRWFLDVNQGITKENLDEFYKNLSEQTRQITQMLEVTNLGQTIAAKTVGGLKDNIDFMNQLNQMFTYVQIPFLMEGKAMHSDLYVFTRKKSLQEKEGKLSALLHLDSDYLGALDIYVEIQDMQVDTQFKVESETLAKLFQTNMQQLSKRIEDKGYQFQYAVALREKTVDFVDDFLARDHGNTPMQRFAFDVRA